MTGCWASHSNDSPEAFRKFAIAGLGEDCNLCKGFDRFAPFPCEWANLAAGTKHEPRPCLTIGRQIYRGEASYPQNVARRLADDAPGVIHILGDADVPSRVDLALICSVSCPGSVIIKTYDAIRDLRDAGVVVAGGFHSPMERECLHFLIRGPQTVVFSPAFGVDWVRLGAEEERAAEEHRLLVASIFGPEVPVATPVYACQRNEFVAALAAIVFVPYAVPGGKAEAAVRHALARGQEVLTLEDRENACLIEIGARPIASTDLRRAARNGM